MSSITNEELLDKFEDLENRIEENKLPNDKTKKSILEALTLNKLSATIILFLFFFHGAQIGEVISTLILFSEKYLFSFLSEEFSKWMSIMFGIYVFCSLVALVFIKDKNRSKFLSNLGIFFIVITAVLIAIDTTVSNNPDKEGWEIGFEILSEGGENTVSAFTKIKCSTYGQLVRDEECISLQNTQTAEVQSNIKVGIQSGANLAQKITLNTPEQGIIIPYSIETETPIKLVKFSCYVNRDELFYETTEFEKEIIRNEDDFNLVCNNIANKMEGKTETFDIVTKLEYNFEQSFSYKIPIINCQDNEILTRINKEETECNNLNFDLDTQTEIKSDNGVVIRVSTFQNNLPIYVGDQYQKNNNYFDLTFDKNEDLGEVKSIKFEDLTYHVALSTQQELIGLDITDLAFSEEAFNIVFDEVQNIEEYYPNAENYEYIQFNLNLVMEKTSRAHQNLEVVKNYQDETTQKEITIENVISQFDYLMSEFERRVPQDSFKTETKIKLESIESRLDNLELRINEDPENTFLQTDLETLVVDINTINQEISNRGIVIELDI